MGLPWQMGAINTDRFTRLMETKDWQKYAFSEANLFKENLCMAKLKGVNGDRAVCLSATMPWGKVNGGC
jgi:hypothetical protein